MPQAFIFDAVRTPRGKGKKDGSLHEVKPVDLLAGLLVKLQKRHGFDPAQLDDVVMGVVSPVGEQGSVIAKTAARLEIAVPRRGTRVSWRSSPFVQ